MKNLKLWALCLVSATLLFTGCSSDDDDDPIDPTPSLRITEIKEKVNGEYQPSMVFTYDDNNLLTKAVNQGWNNETFAPIWKEEYVFERGADGKIIKVTEKSSFNSVASGAPQWVISPDRVHTPTYSGNDIVKITPSNDETEPISYVWENGKIKTVKYDGDEGFDFTYTNGNCLGYSKKDVVTENGVTTTKEENDTISYDNSKNNFQKLIPIEYFLFSEYGDFEGEMMSDNNVTATSSGYKRYDKNEAGELVGYGFFNLSKATVTHTYDKDGVITNYLYSYTSTSTHTDYSTGEIVTNEYQATTDRQITVERF